MQIQLSGHVRRGRRFHIAFCQQLPITTSGETEKEAVESVPEAALSYLSAVRSVDPSRFAMLLRNIQTPAPADPPDEESQPFVEMLPEEPMRALACGVE